MALTGVTLLASACPKCGLWQAKSLEALGRSVARRCPGVHAARLHLKSTVNFCEGEGCHSQLAQKSVDKHAHAHIHTHTYTCGGFLAMGPKRYGVEERDATNKHSEIAKLSNPLQEESTTGVLQNMDPLCVERMTTL